MSGSTRPRSQQRSPRVPVALSANGRTLSLSEQPALTVWVATIDGIIELERTSESHPWRVGRQMLAGSHISSLLFEERSGLLFAGSHYIGGLQVSRDNGATWTDSGTGVNSPHVYSLEVQYVGERTILYAGTEPSMLYRSEDLGRSWHALQGMLEVPDTDKWRFGPPPYLAHLKNVAFHPSQPQTLYVCVEQGDLLKSIDGGANWRAITSYEAAWHQFRRDMHRVVMVPSDPNQVYLSTGVGLFHSENAGEDWVHLTTPDYHVGYPDPLFLDPLNEQTLYMAGASKAPNPSWTELRSAQPGVVRSDDGGRTWRDIRSGLPTPILGNIEAMALQHSTLAGTSLYLGTAVGEVYTSADAGESWTLGASGLPPISKGAHYRRFLSTDDRVKLEQRLTALSTAKPLSTEQHHS